METYQNPHPVPSHDISSITNHTHSDRHHSIEHSGSTILFIFVSCLFGALTRSLVKETNLPFTVFIFVLGGALGILSVLVEQVSAYTLLADIDPHLMLHIFLPVLVFESAYALEPHTLFRSFAQVTVLAVPCFMMNAGLSGILVKYIFPYDWPWSVSMAFGTIISATDPVAVVATLKELGTDKRLAILLEGESLLNDGAALVFFTVFLNMARGEYSAEDNAGGLIVLFFLRVLFGGMLLGFAMGKICSAWLAKIFNDAVAETIITIAFPYITYFIAEATFGVSGVLAVVVLGAVLSSEKTSVSPEVERFLHSQWSLLAFASNTLIFILVGIVITEQGIRELSDSHSYTTMDWFYMIVLYAGITFIRGITILAFSPLLKMLGYGFDWSKGIVMWWGALRGAVSLALALLVAEDDYLDPHTIGNKFLMHAAGIVVLTLVINGCTMRLLLRVLGLTKISMAKKMAMTAAVKALEETQKSMIDNLKTDRFLADAHWDVVMLMSEIKNPYADRMIKESGLKTTIEAKMAEPVSHAHNQIICPDCSSLIKTDLTLSQYKEYEEEARIRYLKAQKVSYWRQFEHGLLGRSAVRKLLELTESTADKPGAFISLKDIRSSWKMRGIYRLFPRISRFLGNLSSALISPPLTEGRKGTFFYRLAMSKILKWMTICILLLQTTAGIVDLFIVFNGLDYHIIFFVFSINFTLFFTGELIIKVLGHGFKRYIRKFWNSVAVLAIIVAYPELYAGYEAERLSTIGDLEEARSYHIMSSMIRICRAVRLLETLLEMCLPAIQKAVDRRIESQINFGYDVGRGFVVGEEECRQLLDHIVEHPGMRDDFKNKCDQKRLAVIKELALLQRSNPGVAVAVKTRQATRTVLNKIIETLNKLKEDGLLDEQEADKLHRNMDKLIKLLASAPPSVPPMPAEHMLSFVPWLQGSGTSIAKFMKQRAQLINFDHNDEILHSGEAPKGIYIIVSGLVKIFGKQRLHSHYTVEQGTKGSQGTNTASADRYTDYLGAGAVLGEMGPLMDSDVTSTVTAETAVQLYFLNITDLEMAFDVYPEVKLKLWKDCAIKIVSNLLSEHKEFQATPAEAAHAFLEKGFIPHITHQTVFNLDDNIMYAFLVHGRVKVYDRPDIELVGPTFIPAKFRILQFNDPHELILYLVPGDELPLLAVDSFHEGIKVKLKAYASAMEKELLKETDRKPARKKKATFYDIINMIRIKKLLNRKTTAALTPEVAEPRPATIEEVTENEDKAGSSSDVAAPVMRVGSAVQPPQIPQPPRVSRNDDKPRRVSSVPAAFESRSQLFKFASEQPIPSQREPKGVSPRHLELGVKNVNINLMEEIGANTQEAAKNKFQSAMQKLKQRQSAVSPVIEVMPAKKSQEMTASHTNNSLQMPRSNLTVSHRHLSTTEGFRTPDQTPSSEAREKIPTPTQPAEKVENLSANKQESKLSNRLSLRDSKNQNTNNPTSSKSRSESISRSDFPNQTDEWRNDVTCTLDSCVSDPIDLGPFASASDVSLEVGQMVEQNKNLSSASWRTTDDVK